MMNDYNNNNNKKFEIDSSGKISLDEDSSDQ